LPWRGEESKAPQVPPGQRRRDQGVARGRPVEDNEARPGFESPVLYFFIKNLNSKTTGRPNVFLAKKTKVFQFVILYVTVHQLFVNFSASIHTPSPKFKQIKLKIYV
jgi:hypothetical protein